MKKISDIGEVGLIGEIGKIIKSGGRTIVGIGDDAAVIEGPAEGMLTLITTDMLIEGVHFETSSATPYQIGWKALGCSLSDIAAMGGLPVSAVVSIGVSGETDIDFVRDIYRGISDLAGRFDCGIVGGDTVRSNKGLAISVAVVGEVEKERLARRSGAEPGDLVCVTGRLGGSSGGKHLRFTPRINEARYIVEKLPAKAMMDLSDGLGSDLFRMAEASGVGFRIDAASIPRNEEMMQGVDNSRALMKALYDGEDFELLVALSPSSRETEDFKEFSSHCDCALTIIGRAVEKEAGIIIIKDGTESPLAEGGYSHFEPV